MSEYIPGRAMSGVGGIGAPLDFLDLGVLGNLLSPAIEERSNHTVTSMPLDPDKTVDPRTTRNPEQHGFGLVIGVVRGENCAWPCR